MDCLVGFSVSQHAGFAAEFFVGTGISFSALQAGFDAVSFKIYFLFVFLFAGFGTEMVSVIQFGIWNFGKYINEMFSTIGADQLFFLVGQTTGFAAEFLLKGGGPVFLSAGFTMHRIDGRIVVMVFFDQMGYPPFDFGTNPSSVFAACGAVFLCGACGCIIYPTSFTYFFVLHKRDLSIGWLYLEHRTDTQGCLKFQQPVWLSE